MCSLSSFFNENLEEKKDDTHYFHLSCRSQVIDMKFKTKNVTRRIRVAVLTGVRLLTEKSRVRFPAETEIFIWCWMLH